MNYQITICTTNGLTYSRMVKLDTYGEIAGLGRALAKAVQAGIKVFPEIKDAELATFSIVPEGAKREKPKSRAKQQRQATVAEMQADAEAASPGI